DPTPGQGLTCRETSAWRQGEWVLDDESDSSLAQHEKDVGRTALTARLIDEVHARDRAVASGRPQLRECPVPGVLWPCAFVAQFLVGNHGAIRRSRVDADARRARFVATTHEVPNRRAEAIHQSKAYRRQVTARELFSRHLELNDSTVLAPGKDHVTPLTPPRHSPQTPH